MKLKDLLFEVRIFQNNFVKIEMVENELSTLFSEKVPEVKFDDSGLYITIDNFQYRDMEMNGGFKKFSLTDAGLVNEVKNIKKYYIEYVAVAKPQNIPTPVPDQTEIPVDSPDSDKTI